MPTQKPRKSAGTRDKSKSVSGSRAARGDASAERKVQGEGDYASAREFNKDERAFVESHDTDELARRAAPEDSADAAEMEAAERRGKARAKPDPEAGDTMSAPDVDSDDDQDDDALETGRS